MRRSATSCVTRACGARPEARSSSTISPPAGRSEMNETRPLARFVADTKFTDVPPGLAANMKIAVLDTVGAGFVGSLQPWARRILATVRNLGGAPEASVIHESWRTDASRAAFA